MKISQNKRAEKIMGKRDMTASPGCVAIPFDQPCELGYHCPVCKYPQTRLGNFDERLEWSEYESFIWCSICNKDYPSCLCYNAQSEIPDFVYGKNHKHRTWIDCAIKVFLDTVEQAQAIPSKGAGG